MDENKAGQSAETALPLRVVNQQIGDWVARLGRIWVEGQILKLSKYGRTYYLTFRDLEADSGLTVVADAGEVEAMSPALEEGSKIVFMGAVEYRAKNGQVMLRARQLQRVGVGNLLVQLEELRRKLEAEGLFSPELKKPLPFLPKKVGLITGRDTDAKKDVIRNARRRWPNTVFEVREIPLQQKETPLMTIKAMNELNQIPEVEVIVIARGGGSMEDLLPWSDEGLVRAVAKNLKPIVSAIGHENDRPIMDYAADVRASTPTDAASKIVPSLEEETARIAALTSRFSALRNGWLQNENRHLQAAQNTLAAKSPKAMIRLWALEVSNQQNRIKDLAKQRINREQAKLDFQSGKLAALSPFAILGRGYALATNSAGEVIRGSKNLAIGEEFKLRLAEDTIDVQRIEDKDK